MIEVTVNGQLYQVDLGQNPPTVHAIKKRKALPHGYSYAKGQDTYLSSIKPDGAIGRLVLKAARSKTVQSLSWREFDGDKTASDPVLAPDITEAMHRLDTRNMSNIQVMRNGSWVWAV
jgi:hypothetical protein